MAQMLSKRFLKRFTLVLIAVGLIIPVVIVTVKKLAMLGSEQVSSVFKPHSVALTINTIFSDQLHTDIKKFVDEQCCEGTILTFDYESFYDELQERFPIVHDMDFDFGPDKVLKLIINGTKPFCRVNQTMVLGNQTYLFDQSFFVTANVQALPNITIDKQWYDDELDAHVYDFVHSIPSDYLQQYDISYHNQYHIVLQPHQSICRCAIIADEKTMFEKRKFEMLSPLFGQLCQRGDITKKMLQSKNIPLVFDFRLKNQIIVKLVPAGKGGKGS